MGKRERGHMVALNHLGTTADAAPILLFTSRCPIVPVVSKATASRLAY